jgi:hypothetical protein
MSNAIVPESMSDLFREMFVKYCGFLAKIVAQIEFIHSGPKEVSGIENPVHSVNDVDYRFSRGDGFRPHMIEAIGSVARLNQLIDNLGHFLPETASGFYFRLAPVFSGCFVHFLCHPFMPFPVVFLMRVHQLPLRQDFRRRVSESASLPTGRNPS